MHICSNNDEEGNEVAYKMENLELTYLLYQIFVKL